MTSATPTTNMPRNYRNALTFWARATSMKALLGLLPGTMTPP